MIGYYVHHQGRGHVSRALAIAAEMQDVVTGISTLPRPAQWSGPWLTLSNDRDDNPRDPRANGQLHWVPVGSDGLRSRMAAIARWIDDTRPQAMVVDVSVEVAVLARLHGIPVVTIALPGRRDDAAHALGYDLSSAIVAAWPAEADGMLVGVSDRTRQRLQPVGAISRFAPAASETTNPTGDGRMRPRVLVLGGGVPDGYTRPTPSQGSVPGWQWTYLGGASGTWSQDPWSELLAADVVITHAGESALAEVAAARRPAVVFPQNRPHGEQQCTAAALTRSDWPVVVAGEVVAGEYAAPDWGALLHTAVALDGRRWQTWNDGLGAARAAAVIHSVALEAGGP